MKLVVLSACVAAACALELSADEHALLESIKLKVLSGPPPVASSRRHACKLLKV